ncbi:MAG: phosphotransferase [Acidimicrobiales bacterium]
MIPSTCEELLAPLLGTVSVGSVTDVNGGRGMFSEVSRVVFDRRPEGLPVSVVVKTPAHGPNGEAARTSGAFTREAMAYDTILPAGQISAPRCYAHSDDGIFVLDDLSGARSVDQLIGASPADARAIAAALGAFHAHWARALHPAALRSNPLAMIPADRFAVGLTSIREIWADSLNPDIVATYEALAARVGDARAGFAALEPTTVTHGDPRLDNIAFVDGEPTFFDWQQIATQSGVADLAWFLATSLEPSTRREANGDIVAAYAMAAGRPPSQIADDLQIAAVYPGLMSLLLATRVPESPRTSELIVTSLRRIGTLLADLGTIERLDAT